MSSTTSTTRRNRRRARIAAVAAAAAVGATAFAAAPAAFAASGPTTPGPSGQLNGVVVVTSTLSIQPAEGSFTLTATPGTPASITPFTITVGSNDSGGYSLVEALTTPFGNIPDTEWTTNTWAFNAGTGQYDTTPVAYDGSGDPVTLYASSTVSGHLNNTSAAFAPAPYSTGGDDVFTTDLTLSLPSNTPGSPGAGYTGAFDYQVIGN